MAAYNGNPFVPFDGTEFDYVPIELNKLGFQTIVQKNGTERIVHLSDELGPQFSRAPELHIKHIQTNLRLVDLLPHFARFGLISEARLMLEFNGKNRGFGFIKYVDKADAEKAMVIMNANAIIRGRKVLVEPSMNRSSLFLSNLPKHMSYDEVKKILWNIVTPKYQNIVMYRSTRDERKHVGFAILEFRSHNDAVAVKKKYNTGLMPLNIEDSVTVAWARPRNMKKEKEEKLEDCYETLRLTCMANYINIPIIIFGAVSEERGVQYCAIVLRSNITQIVRAIFFEVALKPDFDILSRICDVATILILLDEGFIKDNYIIKSVTNTLAFVVGVLHNNSHIKKFSSPREYDFNICYWEEIVDLSYAVCKIASYNVRHLLRIYQTYLRCPFLNNIIVRDRSLHCITTEYRSRLPMKCGITNDEIVFILSYIQTGTNFYHHRPLLPGYILTHDVHFDGRMNLYCGSELHGRDRICLGPDGF